MAIDYWQKLEEGGVYHLYNRSINRELLFREEKDYRLFLEKVVKYLWNYLEFYAYCLIPNHFHFLVSVKTKDREIELILENEKTKCAKLFLENKISINKFLEDQFRRLFSSHAMYYNLFYGRQGSLFQKRPKRVAVKTIEKQLRQICYIHHNPIHHFFVKEFDNWKYSSYKLFLTSDKSFINRKKVFQLFGDGDEKLGRQVFLQLRPAPSRF